MELRNNPAVIRIPVADPASQKDGLLQFALPRECLGGNCEPTFYAKSTPAAPQPWGMDSIAAAAPPDPVSGRPAPAPAPSPPHSDGTPTAALDDVLSGVDRIRTDLGAVANDIDYADFNIRRTRSDFQRADWPIQEAERDTPQTDSSPAGQQLDFIMWSARNSLRDTDQTALRSAADSDNVRFDLTAARQKLTALAGTLKADPQKYAAVLPLLDQADQHLGEVGTGNASVGSTMIAGQQSLQLAEQQLAFSDGQVAQIKADRPGVNVSPIAFQLQSELSFADTRLTMASEQVDVAASETGTCTDALSRAEAALRDARAKLPTE